MLPVIYRTFDNLVVSNNRPERRKTSVESKLFDTSNVGTFCFCGMAEPNPPSARALCLLVIKVTNIVERDSVPFDWLLIAFTVLQDYSLETHCEPGTRMADIHEREMLRLVKCRFR